MPARIVVVHDDSEFIDQAIKLLTSTGWDALGFSHPMGAIKALEEAARIELLVTRVQFGGRRPHGISLALMAKSKRPNIKVLFTALPEFEKEARDVGEFIPLPITPPQLLEAVTRLLKDVGERRQISPVR